MGNLAEDHAATASPFHDRTLTTRGIRMFKRRPPPRLLTVKSARHLTPHMIRVTFSGETLAGLPAGREGANCKILLPEPTETRDAFAARLEAGEVRLRRTYTVRHFREEALELDIDFVDHGDAGPASAWARRATAGSFAGFTGPGMPKLTEFDADFYLVAADMSGLPVASASLEAMPRDARGIAIFEVISAEDEQLIAAPDGVEMRWIVNPDPHRPTRAQLDAIQALPWPRGKTRTCIAGEHATVTAIREYLIRDRGMNRRDAYISGYWKIGMVEDDHQVFKNSDQGKV